MNETHVEEQKLYLKMFYIICACYVGFWFFFALSLSLCCRAYFFSFHIYFSNIHFTNLCVVKQPYYTKCMQHIAPQSNVQCNSDTTHVFHNLNSLLAKCKIADSIQWKIAETVLFLNFRCEGKHSNQKRNDQIRVEFKKINAFSRFFFFWFITHFIDGDKQKSYTGHGFFLIFQK